MVTASDLIEKIKILQLRQNNLLDLYGKHKDEKIVKAFNELQVNLYKIDLMLDKALNDSM